MSQVFLSSLYSLNLPLALRFAPGPQKLCCVCLPCSSHAALPGRAQVSALVPEIQATAMSSPEVSLISVWVIASGYHHLQ